MKYRLAIVLGALAIIAVGIVLYTQTADNFTACASTIGGLVKAFDPASARACANVNAEHYASITMMILGGVAVLIGSMSGKRSA
jgi:hypothetical protein